MVIFVIFMAGEQVNAIVESPLVPVEFGQEYYIVDLFGIEYFDEFSYVCPVSIVRFTILIGSAIPVFIVECPKYSLAQVYCLLGVLGKTLVESKKTVVDGKEVGNFGSLFHVCWSQVGIFKFEQPEN
jgi:hypothetical protein